MTDLSSRSARELLAGLEAREFSAREVLDAHHRRHEARHGDVNAVVATDLERATEEAARIDAARVRGEPLGPLAGLPMTIKDGLDVTGLPAVSGSPSLVDRPRDCPDAAVVALARAAGAVIWGKTNVPLMLNDVQTSNRVYGTTNNPHDTGRTAGGSSGGSAAALATGITPLEIGTDMGGSLRHPANFCGVTALRPTVGLLPTRGQVPPGPGPHVEQDLAVVGPMARSVGDLKLLFDVLRGAVPTPVGRCGGARVAVWLDDPEFVVGDEVREAVTAAASALRDQGVVVEFTRPPVASGSMMDTLFALMYPALAAGIPDHAYDRLLARREAALAALAGGAGRYGDDAFVAMATADHRSVYRASLARQELRERLSAWSAGWDAVLAPVAPVAAFTHRPTGGMGRTLDVDGRTVPYQRMMDWIALATLTGAPALAVPVGRTGAGLPVGVQLVGRPGADDDLFPLAALLEHGDGRPV